MNKEKGVDWVLRGGGELSDFVVKCDTHLARAGNKSRINIGGCAFRYYWLKKDTDITVWDYSNDDTVFKDKVISLDEFRARFNAIIPRELQPTASTIVGYKAPFDMFNGTIKKGDLFNKCTEDISSTSRYRCIKTNDILPKEIVETWEPVCTNYKIGDWVTCINPSKGCWAEDKIGQTFKIYNIVQTVNYGVLLYVYTKPGTNDTTSTAGFELNEVRPATPEETAAASIMWIPANFGPWKVSLVPDSGDGKTINVGCGHYSPRDINGVQYVLNLPNISYLVATDGTKINKRDIIRLQSLLSSSKK